MKKTAIFICGPTAVGKTGVAIELAQALETEIISFDSRQFFEELQIGAAPPSAAELEQVRHHLVGHLSLEDDYNAGSFEIEALAVLEEIFSRKDLVVLVGGSGLYMKALCEGFDDIPSVPAGLRLELNREYEQAGLPPLLLELEENDPQYYQEVDRQNPQRVLRALEVIRGTGKAFSSFRSGRKAERSFDTLKIGLELPRPELYDRINRRVDQMLRNGLEDEARRLQVYREANAMQTVGYREWFPYFEREISREKAIEEIKKNSRRYAKRQMTWFRRDKDIEWFSPHEPGAILAYLKQKINR